MNKVIEIIDSDDDNQTPTSTTNTSLTSNMESDDNQQSQSRRRRRKSVLHAMTDPDMQFQTISLEDDDDDDVNINSNANQPNPIETNQIKNLCSSRTLLKIQKVTPKILSSKGPTNDNIVDANFEKFMNNPETVNDIYAIAEERARINYLLSINGMPEINFTLYTRSERLQFQFEERLKQRKMVNNWDNTRLLDNRRNLLQKNDEQKKTS